MQSTAPEGSRDQVLDATPAGTGRLTTGRSVTGSAGAGFSFGTAVGGALRGGGDTTTAGGADVVGASGAIVGEANGDPGQR